MEYIENILSQFLNILKNSSLGSLNASWFFISSVKMESLCLLQLGKLNKIILNLCFLLKDIYTTSISQSPAVLSQMFFPILSWGGISECHFYGRWKVNEMKVGQFHFYNKDKAAYLVSALVADILSVQYNEVSLLQSDFQPVVWSRDCR